MKLFLVLLLGVWIAPTFARRHDDGDWYCSNTITASKGTQVFRYDCDRAWLAVHVQWVASWNVDVRLESLDPNQLEVHEWTNVRIGSTSAGCTDPIYLRPPVQVTVYATRNETYELVVESDCRNLTDGQEALIIFFSVVGSLLLGSGCFWFCVWVHFSCHEARTKCREIFSVCRKPPTSSRHASSGSSIEYGTLS